jgi:Tol biopolymer transport system component
MLQGAPPFVSEPDRHYHKSTVSRLAFLPFLLLLTAMAFACGGSEGSEPDSDGVAGRAPAGLSLVLFRDTPTNSVIAHSITDGRRWELASDSESEFSTSIDCSPDGQRAAYLKKGLNPGTTMIVSGAEDRPIAISGEASGIAWAPDGSRIAVTEFIPRTQQNQLSLLDPETGEIATVATGSGPIGSPSWSPDGTQIAFDAAEGATNQIFVSTPGGSDAVAVAITNRPQPAFAPDWSPNGIEILYTASSGPSLSQVFAIGPDGQDERQVTTSEISKGFPRWSPDGSVVAYAGTVIVPSVSRHPSLRHNLGVWTMNPDGSGEQQLTDLAQDAWLLGWCVSGPWLDAGWQEVS